MALSPAELTRQESLNQVPSHGWPNGPATHTNHIHVVILNPLPGREMVVDEAGAHPGDLVGAYRRPHATTADCDTAKYITGGYGTGEWNYYVGIVVRGVELISAEIDDIMACRAQPVEQFFF
jgi:hypothetical protein